MSAIITILRSNMDESIQMYVDPEEKIEKIIDRCIGYWGINGTTEEYTLIKNDVELNPDKTVISSEIQDGNVVRFCREENRDDEQVYDGKVSDVDHEDIAMDWLEKNIGFGPEDIDPVKKIDKGGEKQLLFKDAEKKQYYTLVLQNGSVKTYIPAISDVFDDEGGQT